MHAKPQITFSREGLKRLADHARTRSNAHRQEANLTIEAEIKAIGAGVINNMVHQLEQKKKGHSMIPNLEQIYPDSTKSTKPTSPNGYKI